MAQAIKINSAGQVGPRDGIAVSVRNGDDGVLWITDPDNGPWTITFDKVPANPPPFGAPGVDAGGGGANGGLPFPPSALLITSMGAASGSIPMYCKAAR